MLNVVLLTVLCLAFGLGIYGLLVYLGMLPGTSGGRGGGGGGALHAPHLVELPQGCLFALIALALVWFGLWTVVLVAALAFLNRF